MDGLTKLANEIGHARDYGQMASAAARKLLDIVAELNAQRMTALGEQANEIWAIVAKRYVELPKDADGEYIHVGDVMEWVRYGDDNPTIVRTVIGVGYEVFFAWSDELGRYAQYEACAYRHHHTPTVEDVLREFALACEDAGNAGPEVERLAAEYAKRLTLAEEEE